MPRFPMLLLSAALLAAGAHAAPSVYPTGVTRYCSAARNLARICAINDAP